MSKKNLKHQAVEIIACANGFQLVPGARDLRNGMIREATYVFGTLNDLFEWLEENLEDNSDV